MKKTLKRVFAVVMALCIVMMYSFTAVAKQNECHHDTGKKSTLVEHEASEATCEKEGNVKYWSCKYCDKLFVRVGNKLKTTEIVSVSKKSHTEVAIGDAKPASCTEDGITAGKKCSVCNTIIETQKKISATGHKATASEYVAPTCTSTGLTEGSKCSVCGTILKEQDVIPALTHTPVTLVAVEATCTSTGLTEGKKCSVCDAILTEQGVVDKAVHTPEIMPAVEATCTTTGLTEGCKCSVCDTVLTTQEVIPMLSHSIVTDDAVEATCIATGLTAGSHCSVCNKTIVAQEIVDALNHDWKAGDTVSPTCEEDGYIPYTCSKCGETENETLDKIGHKWSESDRTDATVTTAGTVYYTCDNDPSHTKTDTIPALGTGNATTVYVYLKAGHELSGHKATRTGYIYLGSTTMNLESINNAKISDDTTNYVKNNWQTICADLIADCGDLSKANVSICKSYGYNTIDANGIDHSYNGATQTYHVDIIAHNLVDSEAEAATCVTTGHEAGKTCDSCEYTEGRAEIAVNPLNHENIVTDEAVAPTCTETGLTAGSHCSACRTIIVAQEEVPATGHTVVTDKAVEPNCTEAGLTEGSHCRVCGTVLVKQEEVEANGHKFGKWVKVTSQPTSTKVDKPQMFAVSTVYYEHTCEVCGYKEYFEDIVTTTDVDPNGGGTVVDTPVVDNPVVDPEGSEPPVPTPPEEDEITGDAPVSDALGAGSETIDSDAMGDPDAIEDDEEDSVDADAKGVKTGDSTGMMPWAVGFAAAIAALGGAVALRRREN